MPGGRPRSFRRDAAAGRFEAARFSAIAVFFLVLLRLAIGWQFVYEGLWKLNTLSSPKPWTSAGYLRSARGPFRDVFRNMTGDPDDLHWLDYDAVRERPG